MKKYFIQTFGCQMNLAESSIIQKTIEQYNYSKASSYQTANLVILNTCTVRQAPENKVIELIRNLNKLKKTKNIYILLTGCISNLIIGSNRSKPNKILLNKLKGVDLFFSSNDLKSLQGFLEKLSDFNKNTTPVVKHAFSSYIPISQGCDNFCSYCVVPFTRGPEQSRPMNEIITEVTQKVEKGTLEIILLGQNVNSYELEGGKRKLFEEAQKKNSKIKIPLVLLLEKLNEIKGLERIYFLTSHPKDMSLDLINAVGSLSKLCNYVHLPLQSGSDRILNLMNRHYTVKHYLSLIEKIKKRIPDVAITTDIIVGFPGETEKDFQATVNVMKKVGFDMVYISRYSPRPYTASAKFSENIPESLKKKRRLILNDIVEKTALKQNKKLINNKQNILVTTKKDKNIFIGKLRNNKEIHFTSNSPQKIGTIIPIKITKSFPWGLGGEL